MARPSKIEDTNLLEQFKIKLEEGLPVKYICGLLGITRPSFYNWLEKGEEDFNNEEETIYSTFFDTVKKAQASFVNTAIKDIYSGKPNWQSIAWVLERTHQEFAPMRGDSSNITDEKVIVKPGVKK